MTFLIRVADEAEGGIKAVLLQILYSRSDLNGSSSDMNGDVVRAEVNGLI